MRAFVTQGDGLGALRPIDSSMWPAAPRRFFNLRPVIDATCRFEDFPSGLRRVESEGHFGKVVVLAT